MLPTDTALIDQHIKKADQILIGDGHWDHMADVPYIAKKTGAMMIGSETHGNVLTIEGKYMIFLMSSGNFVERELTGIKPDLALVAPLFSG